MILNCQGIWRPGYWVILKQFCHPNSFCWKFGKAISLWRVPLHPHQYSSDRDNFFKIWSPCIDFDFLWLNASFGSELIEPVVYFSELPYALQYNLQLLYLVPNFWRPFLCFQRGFFRKFCSYVWLVFISSL